MKFLDRMFFAVSSEFGNPCGDFQLNKLYTRMPAANEAFSIVDERLEALGVDCDSISNELVELANAYELQGFVNGFRLCAKLAMELSENETTA